LDGRSALTLTLFARSGIELESLGKHFKTYSLFSYIQERKVTQIVSVSYLDFEISKQNYALRKPEVPQQRPDALLMTHASI